MVDIKDVLPPDVEVEASCVKVDDADGDAGDIGLAEGVGE
jgi:hypothetical protein